MTESNRARLLSLVKAWSNCVEQVEMNRHIALDDRRVCVLCNRVITGRMIDVWQDTHGTYHFHCPTPGCPAEPRDWFYHGPITMGAATGRSLAKYRPGRLQGVS